MPAKIRQKGDGEGIKTCSALSGSVVNRDCADRLRRMTKTLPIPNAVIARGHSMQRRSVCKHM
jgi:hypothetical protein